MPCRIDPYDSLGDGEEKEARLALSAAAAQLSQGYRCAAQPINCPPTPTPREGAGGPHRGPGVFTLCRQKKRNTKHIFSPYGECVLLSFLSLLLLALLLAELVNDG